MRAIRETVENGGRLGMEDGIFLYSPEVPLHEVGEFARGSTETLVTTTSIPTSIPRMCVSTDAAFVRFAPTFGIRKGTP